MANVISNWKRVCFVGCSHGYLADPKALATVLKFNKTFKPQIRAHLGDFTDQTAFRSGAHDGPDQTVSIADDIAHGLNFLKEYAPTHLINGNHEDRLWKLAEHHNEIVARAAGSVITEIKDFVSRNKVKYVETYDINSSWIEIGNYKILHGFMFNEQALRDHTEAYGNIVMAHTHKAGIVYGRRSDHPTGFCVGTLANIPGMAYAKTRRATMSWSHGFVFGETNGKTTHLQLCSAPQNQEGGWRLPI